VEYTTYPFDVLTDVFGLAVNDVLTQTYQRCSTVLPTLNIHCEGPQLCMRLNPAGLWTIADVDNLLSTQSIDECLQIYTKHSSPLSA
jgi:hypothetical protein